jgi:hypothetical protein
MDQAPFLTTRKRRRESPTHQFTKFSHILSIWINNVQLVQGIALEPAFMSNFSGGAKLSSD